MSAIADVVGVIRDAIKLTHAFGSQKFQLGNHISNKHVWRRGAGRYTDSRLSLDPLFL